jgi:alkylhydroperoxidase family enzyme
VPHISLGNDAPGIVSLFAYRPETAKPLCDLAEVLLRGPSSLTRGERELIASHVSTLNDCNFCADSHAAFAAAQLPEGMTLVDQVRADPASAPVSAKLGALLRIAGAVQRAGRMCARRTSRRPARPARLTWKFMTRSLSLPRSACSTVTWTGSRLPSLKIRPGMRRWPN